MNFKYLNQLNLSNNYISDLNVFEKAKFDKLQLLDLSGNKNIDKEEFSSIISKLQSSLLQLNLDA